MRFIIWFCPRQSMKSWSFPRGHSQEGFQEKVGRSLCDFRARSLNLRLMTKSQARVATECSMLTYMNGHQNTVCVYQAQRLPHLYEQSGV